MREALRAFAFVVLLLHRCNKNPDPIFMLRTIMLLSSQSGVLWSDVPPIYPHKLAGLQLAKPCFLLPTSELLSLGGKQLTLHRLPMSGFLQKLFSCWIQSSITLTRVARSLMEAPNKLMPPLSWILVRSSMARSKSDRRIFNSENTDAAAGRRPVASFSSWPSPTSIVNPSLGGTCLLT
ncbi:hypothetical protein H4Q26_002082 [Puccinia striiformis f. sp. tritici PST-130]|nr:hypothetical protein H4Q26_002082 [Puccinia striiformis f. sp. tritici PST-130]